MIKKFLGQFKIAELLKFCVGGGSAVAADYLFYRLLQYLGLEIWAAKALSYIIGAAIGFVINKLWTFGSKKFKTSEIIKYVVLYAASAGINAAVNSLVIWLTGIKILAFLAATGVSTVINFLGQKFFVFRDFRKENAKGE